MSGAKLPSSCEGCGRLPRLFEGQPGRLYLAASLAHTRHKIRQTLEEAGDRCSEPAPHILDLSLAAGQLYPLLRRLAGVLSYIEQRACRVLFLPEGRAFDLRALGQFQTFDVLLGLQQADWLVDMLEKDRLVAHFQPIVPAQAPERRFGHECLLRGHLEDGSLVLPGRLFQAARGADLLFQLDRAARFAAIRDTVRHDLDGNVFINFSPAAIYDPAFCLRSTVQAIDSHGLDPARFVFEVVETEQARDIDHLVTICDSYRAFGFRIALDDLGAGYGNLGLLHRLKPDFVKFDMELVRGVDSDPYKQKILRGLLGMCGELGVLTIAEGVETRDEWHWVRDAGVGYVQGYLFARPAAPPSEVSLQLA